MIKRILLTMLVLILFGFPSSSVSAAKKRIRSTRIVSLSYSSAKLSRASHSVVVTFKNLTKVKRIEYSLSYAANGISQGVMGSFIPAGTATDSRDLYFGTCSKGVCTPHYGIANATLTVTTTLASGATNTKRYIIKRV